MTGEEGEKFPGGGNKKQKGPEAAEQEGLPGKFLVDEREETPGGERG